jgi:hypothetical protein
VFGGNAKITKQAMAELGDDNPLRSRYVQVQRIYETIPGPTIHGYQYDDAFETTFTISKQIVDAGASAITHYNGLISYKDEPIDATKTQRVIVETPSLPPTRTEYHTGTYTSPTLIFSLDIKAVDFSCPAGTGSDVRVVVVPDARASQSRETLFKTITSYSYGPPTADDGGLLSPELIKMAYSGLYVSFDLGGVLCNGIDHPEVVCYTCNGVIVACENIIYEATTPSASQYQSYIGTYKKISWESKYWKAGIWQSREIQVKVV